jgi:hypothetical protein
MSAYQFYASSTPGPMTHQNHHSHNSRRRGGPPKLAVQQQQQQHKSLQNAQYHSMRHQMTRPVREPSPEPVNRYIESLEQWCSLDFDDDIEFIPNLLTSDDIISHSSGSERSSIVSSPDASPTQQPQQVATGYLGSSFGHVAMQPTFVSHQNLPIYQPSATRAIAIIDPTTGVPVSSPSPSVSPHRLARTLARW